MALGDAATRDGTAVRRAPLMFAALFSSVVLLAAVADPTPRSAGSPATGGAAPAPAHTASAPRTYAAPDDSSVPASRLLSPSAAAMRAATFAKRVGGVRPSIRLMLYGDYVLQTAQDIDGFAVSPNRRVYVADIALPHGIRTKGRTFGPGAAMYYVLDARTGRYLGSFVRGRRIANVRAR